MRGCQLSYNCSTSGPEEVLFVIGSSPPILGRRCWWVRAKKGESVVSPKHDRYEQMEG